MILGGRYRVEQELGRGGMAKVYRGEDTVLGRAVAIKVLAPQFADDPNFVTRFRREAQAAARISNQNLVSVFDTGSDDGVHFIVMEYVEGKTLAEFLSGGGRIMPDRAIEIAIDVCRALEAAHAQGVIHRDIKPGNIMINQRGEVKVTDFGIARMVSTAETVAQTAAVLGTASYLSPEQAQGQPVDGRSDLYSLGCVLYEMVTGRPPFLGDSPVTVASKQVLEQPTPPSRLNRDVSPDLDAVILRALAKNPANRYQSAPEFRADLERIRRGLPVEATPLLPAAAAATQAIPREAAGATAVLPPDAAAGAGALALVDPGAGHAADPRRARSRPVSARPEPPRRRREHAAERHGPERRRRAIECGEGRSRSGGTRGPRRQGDPGAAAGGGSHRGARDRHRAGPGRERGGADRHRGHADGRRGAGDRHAPDRAGGSDARGRRGGAQRVERRPRAHHATGGEHATSPRGSSRARTRRRAPPVEPGSSVTVFISTGPATVNVPDVTCQSFGSAKQDLRAAGLVAITSTETRPANPLCPNGNKVAAQDPSPNAPVPAGTSVTLFPGEEAPPPTGPTGPTAPTGGSGPTA